MEYLIHDEIMSNSIIVIDFEDGSSVPYFVDTKRVGQASGATMLIGRKLSDIIMTPNLYPCSIFATERYYISNEESEGRHRGVKGYRRLNQQEKNEWRIKLSKSSERLYSLLVLMDEV